MGKHLNEEDITAVVEIVDGWTSKMSWARVCQACGPVIGTIPSRQTLLKFTRITAAYRAKKNRLAGNLTPLPKPTTITLHAAHQRLERLETEASRLRSENKALLEQFIIWQYNAYAHGLSDRELNRPLPDTRQRPAKLSGQQISCKKK